MQIGRNFDGFLNAANKYSKINKASYIKYCKTSAELVKLRKGWNKFIKLSPAVIVVTSGIRMLWNNILGLNNWEHVHLVGGNHFSFDDFIVDPDIKNEIVKKLHKVNKKVIAFGDSRVDALMLKNADFGVVIANERKSPGLAESLADSNTIYQIQIEENKLKNIPVSSFDEVSDFCKKIN